MSESIEQSIKPSGSHRFSTGNTYGKGGKRPGSGRKKKKDKELEQQRQQTALEIYKAEQQRQARQVVSTYYKLAASGKHPHVTVHEIDKIAPDEINQSSAPTTINFIQYNISNDKVSDDNPSPIINVESSSSPIVPASFIKDK